MKQVRNFGNQAVFTCTITVCIFSNVFVYSAILSLSSHRKTCYITFFDRIPYIIICNLNGHHPCAFLDWLSFNFTIGFCNPTFNHICTFGFLKCMLKVYIAVIFHIQICRFGDFFFCHIIIIGIYSHRLIYNSCYKMCIGICLYNSSVTSELRIVFTIFRLSNYKTMLISRFIHQ